MDYFECRVGNTDMFIPTSDKLREKMQKTNTKLNYEKRIAKMRKSYHDEIHDDFIFITPTYIYALEDSLNELGYENILHTTLLNFPLEKQQILYTLFREGKSVRFLMEVNGFSAEKIIKTVQSLFEKTSMTIRS